VILAIDQGTTGTNCMVFDSHAEVIGRAYREFDQHFPRPGWVEHDAAEIWEVTHAAAGEALSDAGLGPGDLEAVGITNQRETVCVWDPASGEPLHHAIVWQDRRTASRCAQLRAEGLEPVVRERTGLCWIRISRRPRSSGCCATLMVSRSARPQEARCSELSTRGLSSSSAARPSPIHRMPRARCCFDTARGTWDPELLEVFGVPEEALPSVGPSCGEVAMTRPAAFHGHAVPVAGVAGDQQAALFGQACVEPGSGKNTYGTGSFLLQNAGTRPPRPVPGLLATVAWRIGGRLTYALEASIFATGAAVQWLCDGLGILASAAESEPLARSLDSNDGVYFVPALTGLGSPHWDPYARGTIVGLTRGSTRAHLARAALESIAYQSVDAVRAVEAASARSLQELRADGGASTNGWLMQFQADLLGVPVLVPEIAETTAQGAAYLAGVGCNLWTIDYLVSTWRERVRYEPAMSAQQRDELLGWWHRGLECARTLANA
jgi:glycerol kinase